MHYINKKTLKLLSKYSVKVKIHCSMNIFGSKSGHFVNGIKCARFISFPQKNANFCCIFGTFKTLKNKLILQQFLLGKKICPFSTTLKWLVLIQKCSYCTVQNEGVWSSWCSTTLWDRIVEFRIRIGSRNSEVRRLEFGCRNFR